MQNRLIWYNLLPRNILSSGVFRRETASGFYPWGKVDSPRKRVAEGLCGWRNGNSFPMTQSAQSHRQMRSIPHCPKAVFYVFVFDSIHNSATLHNLSPGIFHWTGFWFQVPHTCVIPMVHTSKNDKCRHPQWGITAMRCQIACSKYLITCKRCR